MKTRQFNTLLENNLGKELLFEYSNGKFVGANYHLTEVKNVYFDTVDCGGTPNDWKETHLQLWESPNEIGKRKFMTVDKINSIIKKVDGIKPIDQESPIKIEYGNLDFHTSVMKIEDVLVQSDQVIVKLFPESTLCKASDTTRHSEKNEGVEEVCCAESNCC